MGALQLRLQGGGPDREYLGRKIHWEQLGHDRRLRQDVLQGGAFWRNQSTVNISQWGHLGPSTLAKCQRTLCNLVGAHGKTQRMFTNCSGHVFWVGCIFHLHWSTLLVNLGETKKQLQEADFFVVLGTCTYGEKTKCKVSTHFEAKWWQENLVFRLWDIQLRDTIQQ